jgi:hypothetical protein
MAPAQAAPSEGAPPPNGVKVVRGGKIHLDPES